MAVASLHVEVGAIRTCDLAEGDDVDDGADERGRHHDRRAHVGRVDEAVHALGDDQQAENEHRGTVDLGGEDLRPAEAEGHPAAGGPQREPGRPHAETERSSVDQHVRGVREQSERVGDDPEHHLERHEREDQGQRDRERPGVGPGAHAVVVTVMMRHRP